MKKKSEKAPNNRAKKKQLKKTPRKKVLNNVVTGAGAIQCAEDMAVDANEPIYCLCNQSSYGKMVGCDNPDCSIGWFHFQCVKLTTNPKGKWFCPKCGTKRKSK